MIELMTIIIIFRFYYIKCLSRHILCSLNTYLCKIINVINNYCCYKRNDCNKLIEIKINNLLHVIRNHNFNIIQLHNFKCFNKKLYRFIRNHKNRNRWQDWKNKDIFNDKRLCNSVISFYHIYQFFNIILIFFKVQSV